ncbi:Crp/Fnr family transcriptional regulator [Gemmatimonadota bacterium]
MAGTITQKDLFGVLTPDHVHAISDVAEKVKLKAGQTVYTKGDKASWFFVILKGEVALRLPGSEDVSVHVAQLGPGAIFGSCLGFRRAAYAVTAQCTQSAELLKVENKVLKKMMDRDPRMGYILQSYLSDVYFSRYLDTMRKLQAIVVHLPLESA